MPFHFAEAAANLLTHAALDPVAKIPKYKLCAVETASDGGRPVHEHSAPPPAAPLDHPRHPVI